MSNINFSTLGNFGTRYFSKRAIFKQNPTFPDPSSTKPGNRWRVKIPAIEAFFLGLDTPNLAEFTDEDFERKEQTVKFKAIPADTEQLDIIEDTALVNKDRELLIGEDILDEAVKQSNDYNSFVDQEGVTAGLFQFFVISARDNNDPIGTPLPSNLAFSSGIFKTEFTNTIRFKERLVGKVPAIELDVLGADVGDSIKVRMIFMDTDALKNTRSFLMEVDEVAGSKFIKLPDAIIRSRNIQNEDIVQVVARPRQLPEIFS